MKEKNIEPMFCGILIALLVLVVALGFLARSVWPALLVLASMFFLSYALAATTDDADVKRWEYYAFAIVGLGLLAGTMVGFQMVGRWIWLPFWLYAGLLLHEGGAVLRKKRHVIPGWLSTIFAALSVIVGILGPLVLYDLLQGNAVELKLSFTASWTYPLLIFGIISLVWGWRQGRSHHTGWYIFFSLAGILLLAGASWVSGFSLGWWWAPPWLMAAVLIGHAALDIKDSSFGGGFVGLLAALLCGAFAIAGPLWIFPLAPPLPAAQTAREAATAVIPTVEPTLAPTPVPVPVEAAEPGVGGMAALTTFFGAAIRSIWGIFHLLVFFWLGELWLRRWGGWLGLAGLLVAVWVGGGQNPEFLAGMVRVISSSPVGWMEELIRNAGNPGWVMIALGLVATLLIFPALRITYKYQRDMLAVRAFDEILNESIFRRFLAQQSGRVRLASLTTMIVQFGIAISLWITLQRVTPPDISFLGIPDLASPSFIPVWQVRYFVLGGIVGIANFSLVALQKKMKIPTLMPKSGSNFFGAVFGGMLLALFIPAGVMLFLLGQNLAQIAILPLALSRFKIKKPSLAEKRKRKVFRPAAGIRKPTRPQPTRQRPTPVRYKPEQPPVPKPSKTPAKVAPSPELASYFIFKTKDEVVDVLSVEPEVFTVLDKCNRIFKIRNGKVMGKFWRLPLKHALGQLMIADDQFAVIGQEGKILYLKFNEDKCLVEDEFQADINISAYALNPYCTMLAFSSKENGHVHGLFLANKNEQVFAEDLDRITALAFSPDGRYLAVGGTTGAVAVLDIATRQLEHTLIPKSFDPSAVDHLSAGPESTWVSAYAGKDLACWGADGNLLRHLSLPSQATNMCVHPENGEIAVGSRSGYVRVRTFDFEQEIFKEKVQNGKVEKIFLGCSSHSLFALGSDSSVRRIRR